MHVCWKSNISKRKMIPQNPGYHLTPNRSLDVISTYSIGNWSHQRHVHVFRQLSHSGRKKCIAVCFEVQTVQTEVVVSFKKSALLLLYSSWEVKSSSPVILFGMIVISKHISDFISRASPNTNKIKALAGTTRRQQKETICLCLTYKSLIRSLFLFAAPIWYPNVFSSNTNSLPTTLSLTLRIATGCVKTTSLTYYLSQTQTSLVQ